MNYFQELSAVRNSFSQKKNSDNLNVQNKKNSQLSGFQELTFSHSVRAGQTWRETFRSLTKK
jgi:hypothetical protein